MKIAYVAHPLSGPDRASNIARAQRWYGWLLRTFPGRGFVMDWALYAEQLDDTPANRARGLDFDVELIRRCDEVWLVGGYVSPGMDIEQEAGVKAGKKIVDLTFLGLEPPT